MTASPVLSPDAMPGYDPAPEQPARARKPRSKPAPPPAATAAKAPRQRAARKPEAPAPTRHVQHWAAFGVAFTLVLSAALNGYANAQHSPAAWAGWLMGLSVPVLVLVLSKVAGEKHRAGQRGVSLFAGGSGVALLFLSVWHCSQSIAMLTGSALALAVPMAVAIDCGLVACELALISEAARVSHE